MIAQNGWSAKVTPTGNTTGTISVTAPNPFVENEIIVMVSDGETRAVKSSINFIKGTISVSSQTYSLSAESSTISVNVDTDIEYIVDIPQEAQSWISLNAITTRSAIRSEAINFNIAKNEGDSRQAVVSIKNNNGLELKSIVFQQSEDLSYIWDGISYSFDWVWRGENGVYHIKTASELAGLSKCFQDSYLRGNINFKGETIYLDRDIDLAGHEWAPIGKWDGVAFAGTFDGNNHKIKGLKVTKNNNDEYNFVGLFGLVWGSFCVKNLSLEGEILVNTPSGWTFIGGILGSSLSVSAISIENCHTNVQISSSGKSVFIGGIVGEILSNNDTSNLNKCSSKGNINVTNRSARIGGIGGLINNTIVSISSSSCNVELTGDGFIGGIVGNSNKIEVNNSLFSGSINRKANISSGVTHVGGIVASPYNSATISNCLMIGEYYGSGDYLYMSAIAGEVGENTTIFVNDSYYESSLNSKTQYGVPVSEEILKSGSALTGFNNSIWSFPTGEYPYLLF